MAGRETEGLVKKGMITNILEYNPHSGFGDLLNGKKLVRDSNQQLSFNRPLPI
jgi:hypothetical protein